MRPRDVADPARHQHESTDSTSMRTFAALDRHPLRVIAAIAAITALLVVPFLAMAPTESASTEPNGTVFDARDRIDDRFVSNVRPVLLIAEHDDGDVLTADAMNQLADAERALRSSDLVGDALFEFYDTDTERFVDGVLSLVDLVERELSQGGSTLATATDAEVTAAGSALIDRYGERSDSLGISAAS
ncbi:MAG: hypothetical protein AB8G26_03815, partial [Ilumatobacter sp.]